MKNVFSLFLFFFQVSIIFSQKISEHEIVKKSTEYIISYDYLKASGYVDSLISLNPDNASYNYRKGYLLLKFENDFRSALPYFEKASKNVDKDYDMFSVKKESAPVDAFYYLGECYHKNGDFSNALIYLNRFLNYTNDKSELIEVAKLHIAQCNNGLRVTKEFNENEKFDVINLGDSINSQYPDFSLIESLDGAKMFFTSKRPWEDGLSERYRDSSNNQFREDIYFSDKVIGGWSNANRDTSCKIEKNEACVSFNVKSRLIYLYSDSTGNGDINEFNYYGNQLSEGKKINHSGVNSDYWDPHCSVSTDTNEVFFSSDRPGGFGGRDIYWIHKNENGSWSLPVNMGPKINSKFDEDAPFINYTGDKLYYSSNGEKSIGGFDVLVSKREKDTIWTESKQIAGFINSPNDDIFYIETADKSKKYISSDRVGGKGEKDIYEVIDKSSRNVAFKGLIKTLDGTTIPNEFVLNFKFTCLNCADRENDKIDFVNHQTGLIESKLDTCKVYRIDIMDEVKSNMMFSESFSTNCDNKNELIYREYILDVPNRRIIIPQDTIELDTVDIYANKNIEFIHYFDYNKNKIKISDRKLKDFLIEVENQVNNGRKAITINIYSSASFVPTDKFESNEELALIRAENMKYDLINYFENKKDIKGKINVVIVNSEVSGPAYSKDSKKKQKYRPYQFVGLKTE